MVSNYFENFWITYSDEFPAKFSREEIGNP
jgi:hypothetical protein